MNPIGERLRAIARLQPPGRRTVTRVGVGAYGAAAKSTPEAKRIYAREWHRRNKAANSKPRRRAG